MNIPDFTFKYTFIRFEDKNKKVAIFFYPLSMNKNTGGMITTFEDGKELGGEYSLSIKNDNLHIHWLDSEFIFNDTEFGFNLINNGTIAYTFTRPIP